MLMFLAQTPSPSPTSTGGGTAASLLPLILLVGIFYLFLIRPQQRARRNQAMLIQSLQVGDQIETAAGMYGTIRRMDDTSVWVELAPGFEVRMSRGAVRRKLVEPS